MFYPENAGVFLYVGNVYFLHSDLCTWDQLWLQTIWSLFSSSWYIQRTSNLAFSVCWVGQFPRDDWWEQCLKLGSIKWHVHSDYMILLWPSGVLGTICIPEYMVFVPQLKYLTHNWSGAFMLTKAGVVKRPFTVRICHLCAYLLGVPICACAISKNAADSVFF